MKSIQPARYKPTYRKDEIKYICQAARRGDSVCFVGIAGVGKSNIIKFLRQNQHRIDYLGDEAPNVHFCFVDARTWKPDKVGHLWELMLNAMRETTRELFGDEPPPMGPFYAETEFIQAIYIWLEELCQKRKHRVVIVLDDFDRAFAEGSREMLEQFNAFRNAGNSDYLSYLIFTKKLPHVLGRKHNLIDESKFFDLFKTRMFALTPYSREDALQMLTHLNALADYPLKPRDLLAIRELGGGHASLLKTVFEIVRVDPWALSDNAVANLIRYPEVQRECDRILLGLHEQEYDVAIRLAHDRHSPDNAATVRHLYIRGLLERIEPPTWFSPLMEAHLLMRGS